MMVFGPKHPLVRAASPFDTHPPICLPWLTAVAQLGLGSFGGGSIRPSAEVWPLGVSVSPLPALAGGTANEYGKEAQPFLGHTAKTPIG
jgi:hypothetical protein